MKTKVIIFISMILCVSCATTKQYSKLNADFIGFSDDITASYLNDATLRSKSEYKSSIKNKGQRAPIDLLFEKNVGSFNNNIYGLEQGTNTCALYAYDIALDRIEYVQKNWMSKDPNSKYYIVMLTDGLDNNSPARGYDRGRIKDINQGLYINKIEERKKEIMKKYTFFDLFKSKNITNEFYSYVLMYAGEDIRRSNYTDEELNDRLLPYTGSQNTAATPKPIMAESIDELVDKFANEIISSSFTFNVQKSKAGETVKMVLNKEGTIYFQCDIVRRKSLGKNVYSLSNIECSDGLIFTIDPEYKENATSLSFKLKDVKVNNKVLRINNDDVAQFITDGGKLRLNSEYASLSSKEKNAYIIMILDGSKSFKDKFREAQNAAVNIVNIISEL